MSRSPMNSDQERAEYQMSERVLEAIAPVVPGWHSDPHGEHKQRFFDGVTWTASVTHFGPLPCAGCVSN